MTHLERLLSVADEEVLIKVRSLIGKDQLALMIAKYILADTGVQMSPKDASTVLEMPLSTVKDRISKIHVEG